MKTQINPEVIIIGKHSKLWSIVKNSVKYSYDEISYKNIINFDIDRSYQLAIVFSYSKSEKENAELFCALSKYVPKVLYISSTSVEYADNGYYYPYPRIKFFCENYLENKKIFKEVTILKLGLFPEIYWDDQERLFGEYNISTVEDFVNFLNQWTLNGSSNIKVTCKKSFKTSGNIEKTIRKVYRIVRGKNIVSYIVTRLLDIILKKIGYTWYGYSERLK